ncbi:hypothetical protein FJ364_00820 [Candidatus Dependentiae bacterium]|nr:hypothetical protein [Candidatus Dependentiae bacterium]
MLKKILLFGLSFSITQQALPSDRQSNEDSQAAEKSFNILDYLIDPPSYNVVLSSDVSKKRKLEDLYKKTAVDTDFEDQTKSSSDSQSINHEYDVISQVDPNFKLPPFLSQLAQRYEWPYYDVEDEEEKEDDRMMSNNDIKGSSQESSYQDAQREHFSQFLYDNPVIELDYGLPYLEKVLAIFVAKKVLTPEQRDQFITYYTYNWKNQISWEHYVDQSSEHCIDQFFDHFSSLSFQDFQERNILNFFLNHEPVIIDKIQPGSIVVKDVLYDCSGGSKDCPYYEEIREILIMSLSNAVAPCLCPRCEGCKEQRQLRAFIRSTESLSECTCINKQSSSDYAADIFNAGL